MMWIRTSSYLCSPHRRKEIRHIAMHAKTRLLWNMGASAMRESTENLCTHKRHVSLQSCKIRNVCRRQPNRRLGIHRDIESLKGLSNVNCPEGTKENSLATIASKVLAARHKVFSADSILSASYYNTELPRASRKPGEVLISWEFSS